MRLEDKQKITEDLHDRFTKSAVVVVTDYKGLDVSAINELRRKLREEDIEFQVVKNTLLIRAAKDTGVALMLLDLLCQIQIKLMIKNTYQVSQKI